MKRTIEQIKGRIKSISKKQNADARILLRIYMMERFLERLSLSKYRDNFIVKGGILVTSLVGVNFRSTMDIDLSIKGFELSYESIYKIVDYISKLEIDDGVSFEIINTQPIMEDRKYPGIRFSLFGRIGKLSSPIKIDFSTGDIITPKEINYSYRLLIDDETIELWSYNIETIMAEKIDTIIYKGTTNTRIRDYYDVYIIKAIYNDNIDIETLKKAYINTARIRDHISLNQISLNTIDEILGNDEIKKLWIDYANRFDYAKHISYEVVANSIRNLILMMITNL